MKKYFKDILIGEYFGGWGDIHLNYNTPIWIICMKVTNDSAVELNKDGTDGQRFYMNEHDEITVYSYEEALKML